MATITIKFVSNQYDDNSKIKVTEKDIAFPENVTLDIIAMQDALQTIVCSHRSFLYCQASALEANKKEANQTILERLGDAESACARINPHWSGNDEEYRAIQLLTFCIDTAMHSSYLNGKRVMNLPTGGTDLLSAFSDYKNKRIAFGDLKKKVIAFGEGFNDIPFLKDRTIRFTDDDINNLISMYEGIGQPLTWNKKGIKGRQVTKAKLIQQVGLMALKKAFKFSEPVKTEKVTEF